jgi:hypothetical protein
VPDLRDIARRLGGDVSGRQVLCPGPGHSPKDRSRSVRFNGGDDFVVYSHAGDDPLKCKDHVRRLLGWKEFEPRRCPVTAEATPARVIAPAKPYAPRETTRKEAPSRIEALYDYLDENYALLFQVMRFMPKAFRQRRPDGTGGYIYSLDGVRRVPYRLPELVEAVAAKKLVFIAEGKKAVDALVAIGLAATCSPGGAGKWKNEYADYFKGADVIVLPDNDDVGEKHAQDVTRSLAGVATSVRILRLPLPDKGDAFDWICSGGSAKVIGKLIEQTSQHEQQETGPSLVTRCAADIEPEPIDWIWEPRIARGKLTVIGGDPEEGKSQLGVYVAATISKGGAWPNHEGQAALGSVIILSAEDGAPKIP